MTGVRAFTLCVSVGCIFLTVGCGNGDPKTWPVTGTVLFPDGQPLAGGRIEFEAVDQKPPITAKAVLDENGSFTLFTFRPNDGALPGKHRVAVFPPRVDASTIEKFERPEVLEKKAQERKQLKLHTRYQNLRTSGIEYVVKEEANDFKIIVEYDDR